MIAVVGALDAELNTFLDNLEGLQTEAAEPFTFHRGKLFGHEILISKSGVGKVLAAMTTQQVISVYRPSHIIFTGIAGALNPSLNIGDLIVGKDYVQHDMDARDLGFARGEIPYTGLRVVPADQKLVELAAAYKGPSGNTLAGRILSGDQFITQSGKNSHEHLAGELRGDAIEMEGASVAVVCSLNKIPFVVLRTISDRANDSAAVDFTSFLPIASKQSLEVVKYILARLPSV